MRYPVYVFILCSMLILIGCESVSVRADFMSLSGGAMPEEIQKLVTIKDNLTNGDPGLVAPQNGDFRLKHDSASMKLGFKPTPVEKIGLYQNEYH